MTVVPDNISSTRTVTEKQRSNGAVSRNIACARPSLSLTEYEDIWNDTDGLTEEQITGAINYNLSIKMYTFF